MPIIRDVTGWVSPVTEDEALVLYRLAMAAALCDVTGFWGMQEAEGHTEHWHATPQR
jgi:hypothetical protein